MSILNNIRLLLLGSWLGSAIFFSAAVAPNVFRVLGAFDTAYGERNAGLLAGTIVSLTLSVVNTSGVVVSLLLLLAGFVLRKAYRRLNFILQNVVLSIVGVASSVGEWIIAARMRDLRHAMLLPIEQMDINDPSRVLFQTLHGYSVAALSVAMIAAMIAFFIMASRAK